MATFQERFNILFEEHKETQEDFGKRFKASKSQVFNWRNGRGEPDTETIKLIAKACKVSVEWLIGNSEHRTPFEEDVELTIAASGLQNEMKDLSPHNRKLVADFIKMLANQEKRPAD